LQIAHQVTGRQPECNARPDVERRPAQVAAVVGRGLVRSVGLARAGGRQIDMVQPKAVPQFMGPDLWLAFSGEHGGARVVGHACSAAQESGRDDAEPPNAARLVGIAPRVFEIVELVPQAVVVRDVVFDRQPQRRGDADVGQGRGHEIERTAGVVEQELARAAEELHVERPHRQRPLRDPVPDE
jgi:hypothetical protein